MVRATRWVESGRGYSTRFGNVQLIVENLPSSDNEWCFFINDKDGHIYNPEKGKQWGNQFDAQQAAIKWYNGYESGTAVISNDQGKTAGLWYVLLALLVLAACTVVLYYNMEAVQLGYKAIVDGLKSIKQGMVKTLAEVWLWTWRSAAVSGVLWLISDRKNFKGLFIITLIITLTLHFALS